MNGQKLKYFKNKYVQSICSYCYLQKKKKLQEAINSVLNQNYKPIELIIVNNNSYSIKMKKKLSGINIKVFNCFKNFKSANGRNIGANFANGSHLAFLDDDDVWDQNYLKTIHNAYKKNKRDVFVSKLYFYNKKKIYRNFIMESYEKTLNKIFLSNPGFATSNVLIDKKIFNKVGGYDDNSIPAEDRALLIELILSKAKICSTDAKVFYRLNEKYESLSTNYHTTLKGHS